MSALYKNMLLILVLLNNVLTMQGMMRLGQEARRSFPWRSIQQIKNPYLLKSTTPLRRSFAEKVTPEELGTKKIEIPAVTEKSSNVSTGEPSLISRLFAWWYGQEPSSTKESVLSIDSEPLLQPLPNSSTSQSQKLFDLLEYDIVHHEKPSKKTMKSFVEAVLTDNNKDVLNRLIDKHSPMYWIVRSAIDDLGKDPWRRDEEALGKIYENIKIIRQLDAMGGILNETDKNILKDIISKIKPLNTWRSDIIALGELQCIARFYTLLFDLDLFDTINNNSIDIENAIRFGKIDMDSQLADLTFFDSIREKDLRKWKVSRLMTEEIYSLMQLLCGKGPIQDKYKFTFKRIKNFILQFKDRSADGILRRYILKQIDELPTDESEKKLINDILKQEYDLFYKPEWVFKQSESQEIYNILMKDHEKDVNQVFSQFSQLYKLRFFNSPKGKEELFAAIEKDILIGLEKDILSGKMPTTEMVDMFIEAALQENDRDIINRKIANHPLMYWVIDRVFNSLWKNNENNDEFMHIIRQLHGAGAYLSNDDKQELRRNVSNISISDAADAGMFNMDRVKYLKIKDLQFVAHFYKLLLKLSVVEASDNTVVDVEKLIKFSEQNIDEVMKDMLFEVKNKNPKLYELAFFIHSMREPQKQHKKDESRNDKKDRQDRDDHSSSSFDYSTEKNLKELLGLKSNVSAEETKKAFNKYMMKNHPDKVELTPEELNTFKRITAAYNEVKADLDRRIAADRRKNQEATE